MSLALFVLILISALSHALWNTLIKAGISHSKTEPLNASRISPSSSTAVKAQQSYAEQLRVMLILTAVQAAMSVGLLLYFGLPPLHVWPFLLFSGLLHSGYKFMLSSAYRFGDISRVYPLARGAAPLLILLISVLFNLESLSYFDSISVLIISLGILWLAQDALARAENWRLLPFALLSALFTALYTLVDGLGAREAGHAISYLGMVFVFDIALFAPLVYLIYGKSAFVSNKDNWVKGSAAAFFSLFSYLVVVWAMTKAPMAQVSAVRETSVLFAMLLGWIWFKDKLNRNKLLAGLIIVSGLIAMRFFT